MSSRTTSSETTLTNGIQTLRNNAETYGADDAADGVVPADGAPPGHQRLQLDADEIRDRLHLDHSGEAESVRMEVDAARARQVELAGETGDHIRLDLLDGGHLAIAARLGWPIAVAAGVLWIETPMVLHAVAEVFNTEPKLMSVAGGAAVLITFGGAVIGHMRARADYAADEASDPADYASAARTANAMRVALMAIAATAVAARIRAATLAGDDVDSWSLATFIGFQLVLLYLALHLPRHAIENHRRLAADLLRKGVVAAASQHEEAERSEKDVAAEHERQHTRLASGLAAAKQLETNTVARLHPLPEIGAQWRRWPTTSITTVEHGTTDPSNGPSTMPGGDPAPPSPPTEADPLGAVVVDITDHTQTTSGEDMDAAPVDPAALLDDLLNPAAER